MFSNTTSSCANGVNAAPKISYGYGSLFFDPPDRLRFGTEFSQFVTTYNDPKNSTATDDRIQFTTYFVF